MPGAKKVTRSDALAICLHEMKQDTAGSTKSTVWKQNNTDESALDKRIVLLLPETLTMSEWRSLREYNVGTKAAYDFREVGADSDTVGKLLQTGSSKGQPLVLAVKLNEIDPVRHASLQACLDRGLVSCELHGDAHKLWQLTPHGKSMLRSFNQLEKERAVLQPRKDVPWEELHYFELILMCEADGWECRVKRHKANPEAYSKGKPNIFWMKQQDKSLNKLYLQALLTANKHQRSQRSSPRGVAPRCTP